MSVTWTYDGVNTVTATFPSTVGKSYEAVNWGGTVVDFTAVATTTMMTVVGVGSDPYFMATLQNVDDGVWMGAAMFNVGSPSSGDLTGVSWAYDGSETVSVTLPTVSGAYYNFSAKYGDATNAGSSGVSGDGTVQTITLTPFVSGAPPGTVLFYVNEYIEGFGFVTARLGTGGSTTLTFDNPGGATFTPGGSSGPTGPGAGGVRVSIAFDDPSLEPSPTWTDVTGISSSLVASYEIDRGREDEFLGADTGTARVTINDREGVLDPTNAAGPYYTLLEPLRQIMIELWNPVTSAWSTRFRGFIEDYDYVPAPWTHEQAGGHVGNMELEISCVDLTAILSAIEMQPDGSFGDTVPSGAEGNIFFEDGAGNDRIEQVLGNAGIDTAFWIVFTLNVNVQEMIYSASQNVMEVIDDVVDAEFPTVSNRYVDRHGRLAVHGRLAKFDPDGTAASAGVDAWDFHHWKAGDGTAVAASISDTAQIRELAFNRGLGKIFNSALCTPKDIADTDVPGQYSKDATSIGLYGYRSWSSESLIVASGILTGNTANEECLLFATFIVTNYKDPKNRISRLTFKSMDKNDARAAATWDLLSNVDIADMIDVTLHDPGLTNTGGFNAEPFFVEGITETAEPLNGEYAMVTTTLSVSSAANFSDPVGLDGE